MRVVTGMHRSGTSLVGQLLANLGADFGPEEELLGANRWNVKGYFENRYIVDLNNRLILGDYAKVDHWIAANEQGSWLHGLVWAISKVQYLRLPSPGTIVLRARRKRSELESLSRRYAHIVAKDARFSLTIDAWQRSADVERVLYSFRHPAEVAASLRRRERIPYSLGFKQWLDHVERFFEAVDPGRLLMFHYNNLFDPTTRDDEVRRLFRFLDLDWTRDKGQALLERTLDTRLRHHSNDEVPMPAAVALWYERLIELHGRYRG